MMAESVVKALARQDTKKHSSSKKHSSKKHKSSSSSNVVAIDDVGTAAPSTTSLHRRRSVAAIAAEKHARVAAENFTRDVRQAFQFVAAQLLGMVFLSVRLHGRSPTIKHKTSRV